VSLIQFQQVAIYVLVVLFFGSEFLVAQTLEPEALQRKQEDQQRARALTRDLLGGVLDVQLRQLEENGLSDQEIYRDIKLMRRNLNHLVETEMSKVVELLSEARRLPAEKREATFVEARQQIRTVVRQLAIERQNLLKRLKIAELAEQVRRLIRQQSVVQTATKGLSTETQIRQETLTLKTIEDQRDVKELFLHLVDTMVDMKSWSGLLAVTAADGLRILKASEVGKHFDAAGRQLQALKYPVAYDEQELVIKGLKELLKVIERTQGTLNSEHMASIDRIRILTERQKQLREETKSLTDHQPPSAEMVERQSDLQKEIDKLTEVVRDNSKADSHIQQAASAALDAATNLLDGKLEQATADQGRVLGNLAALELALKEGKQQSRDKSANELANVVKALQVAKSMLTEAQIQQDSAELKAETNAQSAATETKQVAEIVQRAMDKLELPAAVVSALTETSHAASEATKNLESAAAEKATAVEEKTLKKEGDALDRAMATVEVALADARRQESAVKIGELARAAEVLERAAAEERAIAQETASLALDDSAASAETLEQAKDLANRQQDVKAIAEKAAEALAETAPIAARDATEGATKSMESGNKLQAVADKKSVDLKEAVTSAVSSATEASQKLAEAAKEIRKEIVATARDLASRTSAQAEGLADARAAVEKAIDDLPSQNKVTQLEAANARLANAMQEQAKAAGKPEAALIMELMKQISNALDTQDSASAAATAAESGLGSELKATTRQEEVVEKSSAAATTAAKRLQAQHAKSQGKHDALAQALNEAQHAAAQAAKQTLDGDQPAAKASRQTAETALKQALNLAEAEANTVMNASPSAPLDRQSQTNAAGATKEAEMMATVASTEAGADINPASVATNAAEQTLTSHPEKAPADQATAVEELQKAEKKLAAAIQKAAADQGKALVQRAKENAMLAERIASIDSAAADAIDAAATAALAGSEAQESPRQMAEAANTAELALEQAAADLGAKEQEIRRDQAIAESVANLAQGQQSAADMIAKQAAQLETMGAADAPSDAEQEAAQRLSDAQQQFADSQRATGQGAVELSGQTEVANPPLREALELASKLPAIDLPSGMLQEAMLPDGTLTPADGQLAADGQPVSADDPPAAEGHSSETQADSKTPGQPHQGNSATKNPANLGTGFVPNSPQLTAEMMAGSKAQLAAQKALGQQLPHAQQSKDTKLPTAQDADLDQGKAIASEQATSSQLTKKEGSETTNQKVKDGGIEKRPEGTDAMAKSSNKDREREENVSARQLKEEAWFAKLPAELRKSIRAGAGQKPPRAYEERLKNYFQSVD
jgi:hypothetical protein